MASTSVMWFRRDLRLHDNPALLAACAADEVVPLFVLDPHLWERAGQVRRAYLAASLRALDDSLGGHLVVRRGDPRDVVPAVAREVEALTVHLAADYGPYGSRRDEEVTAALLEHQVETQPLGSPYAVAPGRVRNGSGDPYKVYSAFARAWADHGWRDPVDAPKRQTWAGLRSDKVPDESLPQGTEIATAGEKAALRAWKKFLDGPVDDYDDGRDIPGGDGVSRMSTYLRWGEIHPRTMLADLARKRSTSSATYRKELAWREFYADVLWHRPDSARRDYRESFSAMTYDDPGEAFEAWKKGETGFPIVDAGMRELVATGFMHNRVRMIVASFLVKDLHVWWWHGARHFMEWLADGDLASNQLNWQWVAGSGTDAAPYFRIFNPTSQGRKFDPDGTYIRRWVPELADVPAKQIHEPQDVEGYPAPIVDHKEERAESLRRFGSVKTAGRG
jgi:deoxyribodipyrimidine photo-lyase